MTHRLTVTTLAALLCLALIPLAAIAADDDAALDLQVSPPEPSTLAAAASAGQPGRLSAELAYGRLQRRSTGESIDTHRVSIDFRREWTLAPGWRLGLSDRLDQQSPQEPGDRSTLNSLREAYVSWQSDGAEAWGVDLGRVQWRNGPGYGFNPTDYFRRGSLRTLTTADPIALRENRLGTAMLRVQRLWADGSVSVALAPKLADAPSSSSASLDLGSTNNSDRLLAVWSQRLPGGINAQALLLAERHKSPSVGASATALLSAAAVGFVEWSGGSERAAIDVAAGRPAPQAWRNRLAAGLTHTTTSRLSLTAEYDYNGAAPDGATWDRALLLAPQDIEQVLRASALAQDSASRSAWLVYVTQKSLLLKDLDLTALLRRNQQDGSTFAWLELRHHFKTADLALQWQRAQGRAGSEYGLIPARQWLQAVGTWYF